MHEKCKLVVEATIDNIWPWDDEGGPEVELVQSRELSWEVTGSRSYCNNCSYNLVASCRLLSDYHNAETIATGRASYTEG